MPELPEVETIKRGLSLLIINKTIKSAKHDNPKSFPNSKDEVSSFIIGAKVIDIRRRAKVLMIDLSSEHTLVTHLKMTGQLVYVDKKPAVPDDKLPIANNRLPVTNEAELRFGAGHPNDSLIGELPDKSTRVTLEFNDGSKLFFNDQRKFGWMKLFPTIEVPNIDFMKKVGPEPLEDDLTPEGFVERFKRRPRTNIKAALLDQTVVAGVGNIYADESLWAARIHPSTLVNQINDKSLKDLFKSLKEVLLLSIDKGGSTDRNYVNAEGKKGSYIDFAAVFRKEGQPCPRCGTEIIKTRVAGRGTHLCPVCQKLP